MQLLSTSIYPPIRAVRPRAQRRTLPDGRRRATARPGRAAGPVYRETSVDDAPAITRCTLVVCSVRGVPRLRIQAGSLDSAPCWVEPLSPCRAGPGEHPLAAVRGTCRTRRAWWERVATASSNLDLLAFVLFALALLRDGGPAGPCRATRPASRRGPDRADSGVSRARCGIIPARWRRANWMVRLA
jgi:hypothetical protein